MNGRNRKIWITIIRNTARILLLAVIITAGVFYINDKEEFTLGNLLALAPHNYYLAAAFMLFMFAVKSLFFAFPIIIPYLVSGIILPPLWAFLINIAGSAVTATIPYLMGRLSGRETVDKMLAKYPKIREILPRSDSNKWFVAYLIRIVSIFPVDIVSMFLGTTRIQYKTYITASMVGMLPGVIFATLIGRNITNPKSPGFILSIAASIILAIVSVIFYKIKTNSDRKKDAGSIT